jgi:signal transduction histidine kinase
VPERDRARIFEPFSRGRAPTGAGTGLGLAVSRTIARRFGGDVVLAPSTVGARFEVRLPARDGDSNDQPR